MFPPGQTLGVVCGNRFRILCFLPASRFFSTDSAEGQDPEPLVQNQQGPGEHGPLKEKHKPGPDREFWTSAVNQKQLPEFTRRT